MPTLRTRRLPALLVALSLVAACTDPTGTDAAPLAITTTDTEIRVANRGTRPVHVFVVDRERLALILWAPCVDPVPCPALAPGAVDTTRFDGTNGLARGREAVVTWWYARSTPRGLEPDDLHEIVVRL
jgi:hypothetical protein